MEYKIKRLTQIAIGVPIVVGASLLANKQFRKGVKNMSVTHVDVQNCIDKCTQNAQKIRMIANDVVDHRARYALAEADRHMELCIHSCLDAKTMTNRQ